MKEKLLGLIEAAKEGIADFFKYDRAFKLISLAIAIGLWLFMGAQNPESTRTYRDVAIDFVTNMKTDQSLVLISSDESEANVTVSAKRSAILNMTAMDIALSVDATDISEPGTYTLSVVPSTKLSDISIDKVSPSKITARLDYMDTKTVPVEIAVNSALPENEYVIGEVKASLSEISVTGPRTELSTVVKGYAVLNLTESGSYDKNLSVIFVDANGNNVDDRYFTLGSSKVNVTTDVYAKKTVNLTADLDTTGLNYGAEYYDISVYPDSIEVYGVDDVIDALDSISIGSFRPDELSEGSFNATITMPSGVFNATDIVNATVTVRYSGVEDRKIQTTDIRLANVPSDMTAQIGEHTATITLRTAESVTPEDVYLTVDLADSEAGTAEYEAKVTVLNGKKADVIGTVTVSVNLMHE